MGSYIVGDRVQSCTGDSDLPDGTLGTVTAVGEDYGDGFDMVNGSGYNVLDVGLAPA
ncbi:hypothetical protein ACWFRT_26040 [Streptomyces anulatus]